MARWISWRHPARRVTRQGFRRCFLADADGNGLDDGREVQANMYQGMLSVMNRHPGVVNALFLWDNWLAGDDLWAGYWAGRRTFAVRDKLSEGIVRAVYARWGERWSAGCGGRDSLPGRNRRTNPAVASGFGALFRRPRE